VEGSPSAGSDILYSREEAKAYFREARAAARMPFIHLSGGVSNQRFEDARELSAEAGANFSGLLCGRATGKDGGRHFGAASDERIGKLAEKRRNPEYPARERKIVDSTAEARELREWTDNGSARGKS
jgi:tagatose 1,6-diphosphate aldolase